MCGQEVSKMPLPTVVRFGLQFDRMSPTGKILSFLTQCNENVDTKWNTILIQASQVRYILPSDSKYPRKMYDLAPDIKISRRLFFVIE